jgi:hypothetical protein
MTNSIKDRINEQIRNFLAAPMDSATSDNLASFMSNNGFNNIEISSNEDFLNIFLNELLDDLCHDGNFMAPFDDTRSDAAGDLLSQKESFLTNLETFGILQEKGGSALDVISTDSISGTFLDELHSFLETLPHQETGSNEEKFRVNLLEATTKIWSDFSEMLTGIEKVKESVHTWPGSGTHPRINSNGNGERSR